MYYGEGKRDCLQRYMGELPTEIEKKMFNIFIGEVKWVQRFSKTHQMHILNVCILLYVDYVAMQ